MIRDETSPVSLWDVPWLVASGNENKLEELRVIGDELGIVLVSPAEVLVERNLGPIPDVVEDGLDYFANAMLKAHAFSAWAGMPALADDTGLEVTALDNRPGLHSARYAGEGTSHKIKMEHLLAELAEVEQQNSEVSREAFFRCCLVLYSPEGAWLRADSSLRGHVLREPRGEKGFGYDPIIEIDELGRTLAEIDFEVTCRQGFRAKALRLLYSQRS